MNILLTSVGRRTYMVQYFKEALNGSGKVHAANSIKTYTMDVADESVVTPLIYDDGYIDFLLKYCIENKINAIISLFDIDLPVLAKNKDRFTKVGITTIVSDSWFIKICNDKWLTYKFLKDNGIKTPASFLNIKDSLSAIKQGEVNYPLIIKPRWGMGSIGIFEADNADELQIFYNKTKRAIQNSYLRYESQQAPDQCIIVQEKLCGGEYGIDLFHDLEGNFLTSVCKKKIAMRAGETDGAEIIEDAKLNDLAVNISNLSKHIGNLDIDCFGVDDTFYVLELNCRFGGQYPFSHLAGVNFPAALIQMLTNQEINKQYLIAHSGSVGYKDLVPVKLK